LDATAVEPEDSVVPTARPKDTDATAVGPMVRFKDIVATAVATKKPAGWHRRSCFLFRPTVVSSEF